MQDSVKCWQRTVSSLDRLVENANTHPDLQKWINELMGMLLQDLSNTVGAAFVTAGGLSAGEERDYKQSDSDNDDIPNDNCWGKFHGYVHFGASAITYESPFSASEIEDVGDNDGDDYSNTLLYFSKECHESKQTIVHPLFLNKARGVGERVAQ